MTELIIACFIFILIDIVSGVLAAAKDGELCSSSMREGLYHKSGEIVIVVLAVSAQQLLDGTTLSEIVPLGVFNAVAAYVIVMEMVSIIENALKLNPNMSADTLKKIFVKKED